MHRIGIALMAGIVAFWCVSVSAAPDENLSSGHQEVINIGFAKSLFSDVNANDAVASIGFWAETIARSKGIPIEMEVTIFDSSASLEAAMVQESVDLIALLTPEFLDIGQRVEFDYLYATQVRDTLLEEYLLLVREDSSYTDLSQLAGITLVSLNNGRCSLSTAWLDYHLVLQGLPQSSRHFGGFKYEIRANKVILPVFFGKAEACLVTRNAFETMRELNPQVGRTLRVIAQSPPYIPAVFCFRSNFQSQYLGQILEGLDELHTQPSGEQVLIVFRGNRLIRIAEDDLDNARLLMDLPAE